ncbi:MAG: hypothetical protein VX278_20320 [Myxococcota bacterium]|nr:hypothetical protein [Myxococcota bacterium]
MILLSLLGSVISVANANPSLMIGTDVPYQVNLGAAYDAGPVRFSFRSGILAGPYSTLTLSIVEMLGTDEVYINLLEASYQFGSMNSLGTQYMFGQKKRWQIGTEFRFDYLFASETPEELIDAVTGESSTPSGPFIAERNIEMSLMMYAIGLRFGREFVVGKDEHHSFLIEFSLFKHFSTVTRLNINGEYAERLTDSLDTLLWEEVFLPYGYLGGVGLNYKYTF